MFDEQQFSEAARFKTGSRSRHRRDDSGKRVQHD